MLKINHPPKKDKNIPDPKLVVPINNNISSAIDQEEEEIKKENNSLNKENANNNSKNKGKKLKGKPVDFNAKTGFFTVSQQERNYEPMYICGDEAKK